MAFQNLTENVPFWNSNPADLKVGDAVEGKVVLINEARDSKSSRTAVLELADGKRVAVQLSTVIDGAFKAGINEGDTVRVTYNGKQESKKGTEYNDYTVEVDR